MLTPPRPHRQASAVRWKHSLSEGRAERADDVLAMDLRRPNLEALSAIAALLVLIGSDFYARRFWLDHPVTTAILASLTVVLVSVTVIDVVLTRRSERRWRLLAQYALLELAEAAQDAWGVLASVVDDKHTRTGKAADPEPITEILDSPGGARSKKPSTPPANSLAAGQSY